MRTYSLIIIKYSLCGMPFKSKGHLKCSLGGKLLLLYYRSFESSIYLKIEMLIILGNKEVTLRVLGIDSTSLIYI
jgi:hypothetical protein